METKNTSLCEESLIDRSLRIFLLSLHLPTIQLFISTWEKNYEDIYHFPPHVSVITRNILITIIRINTPII